MSAAGQPTGRPVNGVHVFAVDGRSYAYDRTRQDLVAIKGELAALLAGRSTGTPAARAALDRARRDDGLFLGAAPTLAPRPPDLSCDRDLEHLVLTVTEECDLRCAYCVHGADLDWVRSHSSRRMDVATAGRAVAYFLDRCRPDRPPAVSFYGGEALLHRALIRAVAARVRGHPRGEEAVLAVDSNGYGWDPAAIELMATARMHVQVSLDGPPEIHDRHRRDRRGRPTCARILANVDRLLARDPAAAERLAFVATVAPPVDLEAVAGFFAQLPPFAARGLPAPHVRVNFANLEGQDWGEVPDVPPGRPPVAAQVANLRESWFAAIAAGADPGPVARSLFQADLLRLHHRSRGQLGSTYTPGGNCRPGRRRLHVTPDGALHVCEKTGAALPIGDLGRGIDRAAVLRVEHDFHAAVADRCAGCWLLRLCSVCYGAQAGQAGGGSGIPAVPEAACRRARARAEDGLRLLVRILSLPVERRRWLENVTFR